MIRVPLGPMNVVYNPGGSNFQTLSTSDLVSQILALFISRQEGKCKAEKELGQALISLTPPHTGVQVIKVNKWTPVPIAKQNF